MDEFLVFVTLSGADERSVGRFSGTVVVGRSDQCDVRLPHPLVSRRHAQLSRTDDGAIVIRDLGSSNGTIAEDTVLRDEELVVPQTATLRIGPYSIVVSTDVASADMTLIEQPRRVLDSERGLQTILFTDLAGSTAMQSRVGDTAAHEVLRAHDAAVRTAIDEFGGREVKHTGDGMMAAFGSAADAVNCALQVRREIETYNDTHEGEELRVRFGLNAGEPIAENDDLFGLSVTLAARIGDYGEPGHVVVSNVVRELLLGKGFEFEALGEAELKGFDEPVALFEVSPES